MLLTNKEATEFEVHKWVTEASTLRIPPTDPYPRLIETNLGNGQPFLYIRMTGGAAIYRQHLGCLELHVLND